MAAIRGVELTREHIGKSVVVRMMMGVVVFGWIEGFDESGVVIKGMDRFSGVKTYPFDVVDWWE